MRFSKSYVCLLSVILVGLLLFSCSYYRAVPVRKEQPPSLNEKLLHLIWDKQPENNYYLRNATLQDSTLTGKLELIQNDKVRKANLINIYVKDDYQLGVPAPDSFSIPLSKISKLEIHEYDLATSVVETVLFMAGIGVVASVAIALLILAFKESCPFIYTWNGTEYELTGEIYSGAIYPGLERHDYLPLPNLQAKDNQYLLQMANKVKEIQHTNVAELLVIDHPQGTHVLVDRNRKFLTYSNLQKPTAARTDTQPDILALIAMKDSLRYMGDTPIDAQQKLNTIYLSFERPTSACTAKLVLRAKNSYWLDYTFNEFFNLFGDKYDDWYAKQAKKPASEQNNWALNQGIPLLVYTQLNGEWDFADYFNVVGPVADRDIIMPIYLPQSDSGLVNLKLECGPMFWEIDFAGMDFSPAERIYSQVVNLTSAYDQDGKDVRPMLLADDKDYYTMALTGNSADLTFPVPAIRDGMQRTVFLHGKGHYKVLRNPTGKPDVAYLKKFTQAGRFGEFSSQRFLDLKQHLSKH